MFIHSGCGIKIRLRIVPKSNTAPVIKQDRSQSELVNLPVTNPPTKEESVQMRIIHIYALAGKLSTKLLIATLLV